METQTDSHKQGHRVSWLELFYDLVYVVIIARLAHLVTVGHEGHVGLRDIVMFTGLFIPVWWAWTGHTLYATRFYTDSVFERVLTLAQMFLVMLMTVYITDAFHGEGHLFALAYGSIRTILVLMYLRGYIRHQRSQPVCSCLASGFVIGALLWLGSALLPPPWMYGLWLAGLVIDISTTFRCRPLLKRMAVHRHHLPERYGLMVIILLGESVASLTSALTSHELSLPILLIALLGFISLSAVWWHYFAVLEKLVIDRELGAAQLIIYGHLPILVGLALFASALRQNIVASLAVPDIALLFTTSMSLYLLPVLLIAQQWQAPHERWPLRRNTLMLFIAFGLLLAVRYRFDTLGIAAVMALLLVLYVYLNTPRHQETGA